MKHLLLSALFLSAPVFSSTQVCSFDYSKEGTILSWTAFKTPKKVGVKAKFSDFTINAPVKATNLDALLLGSTFDVNSSSVDSGDKARDAKIAQFFFKKTKISGKVLKVSGDKVEVELNMNGTKKVVEMKSSYSEASKLLTLTGAIDVLEFAMKDNLATLTKACFEKHEGVTWPQVDLELVATVTKSCK